ncbi:hypothetical protein [Burkholderia territorii]|uniref:hypothetical protein n=1 Tax=Burkholderia territorii TaxID=1503055 RepID=UPI000AB0DCB0|nr:hypothetical protein [Burkholderia territorii]
MAFFCAGSIGSAPRIVINGVGAIVARSLATKQNATASRGVFPLPATLLRRTPAHPARIGQ